MYVCHVFPLSGTAAAALNFLVVSKIRETLVTMFAGSVPVRHSEHGDYSTTEQHVNALMSADNHRPVDPSTCVFWSAIALGSLVQGRPVESVRNDGQQYPSHLS